MTGDPKSEQGIRRPSSRGETVTPLRPKLSQTAQRLLDSVRFAGEAQPVLDHDYVVKGWLNRDSVSVVYGEANVGKSFWALDLAHHVQQGRAWAGYRVTAGPVLYIAAEGGTLFTNRLAAAQRSSWCCRRP